MSAKKLYLIGMVGFFIFYVGLFLRQPSISFQEGDIFFQDATNLNKIDDWKNIVELIPEFYLNNKMKRTGIAGIFAASLELTKEGLTKVSQNKMFDDLMIKKS